MKITKEIISQLIEYAKKEAPVEACGYLGSKTGVITTLYALKNIDKSNEHFSFDPKEQFRTVKAARDKGIEICAVYHSHPISPARPSEEDIKLAYDPAIVYIIVSLANNKEEVKAFNIKNSEVEEIILEIQ